MKITWLSHSCFEMDESMNILVHLGLNKPNFRL